MFNHKWCAENNELLCFTANEVIELPLVLTLQKLPRPALYRELFHASFLGLVEDTDPTEEIKWVAFTFLKVRRSSVTNTFFHPLIIVIIMMVIYIMQLHVSCNYTLLCCFIIAPAVAELPCRRSNTFRRNKFLPGTHLLHLGQERQLWTKCIV